MQPVLGIVNVTIATPVDTGVITPVELPIVNTDGSALVHIPVPVGGVALVRVELEPIQTPSSPYVRSIGLTVTTTVEKQPDPRI